MTVNVVCKECHYVTTGDIDTAVPIQPVCMWYQYPIPADRATARQPLRQVHTKWLQLVQGIHKSMVRFQWWIKGNRTIRLYIPCTVTASCTKDTALPADMQAICYTICGGSDFTWYENSHEICIHVSCDVTIEARRAGSDNNLSSSVN